MASMMILSVCVSMGLTVLSLIFKVAGKLRLSLPILYILAAAISTLFTDWVTQHEAAVLIGLYVLIGLVVLSWILSLVSTIRAKRQECFEENDIAWQLRRAREMGVPLDNITFDSNQNLIDPRTGHPVNYSAGK